MDIDYRGEHVDLGRLWKQLVHKVWIIIAATAVGAIIGVLAYVIYAKIVGGDQMYELRNDYYIYLDYIGVPSGPDYYNAYTWDSLLRDDPIVNCALEANSNLTKEQIVSSVTGEILGDYRILTVVVRGTDKELIQSISDAYEVALPNFASVVEAIDHIDLWTDADIVEYDAYTRDGNAAFLGGLIGLIISVFAVMITVILDTRIYNEHDWNIRHPGIPFLGKNGTTEYEVNYNYIVGSTNQIHEIVVNQFEINDAAFSKMRNEDGVILGIADGRDKGEDIEKVVSTLKKQDITIIAAYFI